MNARKHASGSDLQKDEARPVTREQYDEIPELTEDWFEGAELHVGGAKVPRGRPRSPSRKLPLKLRIDPDVVKAFRATGPGWQTRMTAALRRAARRLGADRPTKLKKVRAARRKSVARKRRA
jgi:uncharacterized protein (DUF4415 family)